MTCNSISWMTWTFNCSLQIVIIYTSFEWYKQKSQHHQLSLSKFLTLTEYHFHPILHMPWFFISLWSNFFSILYIIVGFHLAFLYVNPISFSWFLSVLSQTLTLVLTHLWLNDNFVVSSFVLEIFIGAINLKCSLLIKQF